MKHTVPVVSPHLYVPPKSTIEAQTLDFYLRMRRHLRPREQTSSIPRSKRDRVSQVAKQIHRRRELAAGIHALADHHKEKIEKLARDGARICGPLTAHSVDEWAADVHAQTPWMHELTTLLMKSMRKQVKTGQTGLKMPPLLLVGDPGNGKSWYAEMVGRVAGVPVREIDLGGGSASFRISGLEKGWSGANPGIPVEMMLDHRIANPVIVVNEICKAGERVTSSSGSVSSLTTALLQVLEPETAARFECPAFRIRFDLSRINFVLTANDLDRVPAPLRDRCQVFRMPVVTPSVAGLMFDTLSGPMLTDVDPDVVGIAKSQILRAAARGHVSLRQIRRVLDAIAADCSEPLH
jgi:hypothetical protein